MEEECEKCKAASAHGTKTSNAKNKNKELRFTIAPGARHWQRWLKKYLI